MQVFAEAGSPRYALMIIPYSTDAPIYHLPFATVGVMVVTVGIFAACAMRAGKMESEVPTSLAEIEVTLVNAISGEKLFIDPYEAVIDPYILHYGRFNPLEWVTSNFMHADWLHLFGNMAGLWGLGLIVEGKVGWWRFLLMYFGIGAAQCGMEQTLMLWASDGGSLGASSIVYGMLVVAVLWAPRNDLNCFTWFFRPAVMDVTVPIYASIVIGIEIVLGILSNFSFGSTFLHMMGALVGLVVGLAMLKLKWVDCEGFDVISEWRKQRGVIEKPQPEKREVASPEQLAQQRQMALGQIEQFIAEGNLKLALVAHQRMAKQFTDWQLPAAKHLQLITAMQKQEMWSESMPLMVDYLRLHRQRAARVRLQLAKILIEREKRPSQALKVIAKIDPNELDEKLQKIAAQLRRKAASMLKEGEVEMATEDW